MFGSSKSSENPKNTAVSTPASGLNALVKGTTVEGTVRCDTDIRVDGTIKGKLHCKGKVILGPTGAIEGEMTCQNAVLEGRFKGTLRVTELLSIRETADVDGDISTGKLSVQNGAKFNVACAMGDHSGNGMSKTSDVKSNDSAKIATEKSPVRN